MKLLYGLTSQQMQEIHDEVKREKSKGNVIFVAEKAFPNEKFSEEEIRIATCYAFCFDDDETDWVKYAKDALQMVIDERPHEEPPKSRLDQVLSSYGLKAGQVFNILNPNYNGLYYFDDVGDLYYFDPRNGGSFKCSDKTLGTFLTDFAYNEILPSSYNIYDALYKKFYFTFGTDEAYPFQGGWVEVIAYDKTEAISKFNQHYPKREGSSCYNACDCYGSSYFEKSDMFKEGNLGAFCHKKIY